MITWCGEQGFDLTFIETMPMGEIEQNRVDQYIPLTLVRENIEKNWKLDEIKMIEGLLFISMLPLHSDNLERQLAFFCVGIERLNEIFGV